MAHNSVIVILLLAFFFVYFVMEAPNALLMAGYLAYGWICPSSEWPTNFVCQRIDVLKFLGRCLEVHTHVVV